MEKRIIYISRVCSKELFSDLMTRGQVLHQPAQKFHRMMIEGLRQNDIDVNCITSIPLPIEDKIFNKAFYENKDDIKYYYTCSSNKSMINRLLTLIYTFFKTLSLNKKKDTIVVCDILDISLSLGSYLACKLLRIPFISVITDLASDLSDNKKSLFVRISDYLMYHSDGYVFLSKYMNDLINKKNKKYVIIEGMVDYKLQDVFFDNEKIYKDDKKIMMYAGALAAKYGVKKMIDAFIKLNDENLFLYIYGYGELEEYIKDVCQTNRNISFFGLVKNEEIVEIERKVDVLINPRPSDHEFTLYSFPSKNMEYLSSGTSMLCTKLKCIPSEYDDYLFYIEDESEDGFVECYKEIVKKDKEELNAFGHKAKIWVLENKNNVKQTQKIVDVFLGDEI